MKNEEIYISLPLLKSKILTEKDEKSAIFKRFFRAESVFLEENDDILIDIWQYKKYVYSQQKIKKETDLALFETEIFSINKQNPVILIGKEKEEFWLGNTAIDKSFFKNLKILPLFECNQKKNIYAKALKIFRKHYQTHWQNQIKLLTKSFDSFFNTSEWESLQIKENLAFALKEWIFWIESEQNYVSIRKNIITPTLESEKLFDKLKRKFEETHRKFEKLKKSDCKDIESKELLEEYFEIAENNLAFLENFWESNEKIYEVEIKYEDVFYYTLAILMQKRNAQNITFSTDFYEKMEIELLPDFFEYVEKGQNLFRICTDFQNIYSSVSIKEKKIENSNNNDNNNNNHNITKKSIKFIQNEQVIVVNEEFILENIPDIFWTYKIGKKTFAERLQKEKNETKDIVEKIKKYVGFLEVMN